MSNKLKKTQKQKESLCTAVRQFAEYVLNILICSYMLLVIVVMPFYNEQGYSYIGTNKATFFRVISVNGAKFILPVLAVYLVLLAVEKVQSGKKLWQDFKVRLSVTDKFALVYGASLLLSYAFSDYKEMALWGAEGWFMGLIPQLFLLGIYFMVSRLWNRKEWMFLLFLPVSAVVFLLGYLNRFGVYPIDMQIVNPHFLSTIGNINWYCGYLVSVFFGGYFLLWKQGGALLTIYVAIGFATLVTQGSLSGLVTLGVMLIVTFCMSAKNGRRMQAFWQGTLILSLMCLLTWCIRVVFGQEITFTDAFVELLTYSIFPIIVTVLSIVFVLWMQYCNAHNKYPAKLFGWLQKIVSVGAAAGVCLLVGMIVLNTLRPGSLGSLSEISVLTFSPEWGSNRGATWKAGVMCFAEQNLLHKLVGIGPDTMDAFLSKGASAELVSLVKERFGNDRLTNAHCEWLTILVHEGIIGFVGFVGMMVSAIKRYIGQGVTLQKTGTAKTQDAELMPRVILGACGFCLLAYTVNNMFSFQQSMSVATIFIILGIGEAYARAYASCYIL